MFTEEQMLAENGTSAALSKKNWAYFMCLSLLNAIPIVGSIAYLVILIYLTVKKDTAVSLRNYLVAMWLLAAVVFVILLLWTMATVIILGNSQS